MKKKKNKGPFDNLQKASTSFAGLGITNAITAGIGAKAPAGTPSLTQGSNTIASFAPLVGTAIGGKSVLKQVKKLKKF